MKSEILERWQNAPNYTGEDFSDYYVVTSFNRDSNVYEVANYLAIARHLSAIEPESDNGWIIVRFGHWMHGYLYCILVHKDSPLVPLCEEIAKALREYPVFDENVLTECESMIEESLESLSENVDTETGMQTVIEAPAALICEPLLKPYL
jgi:hypothetical protein